MMDGIYPHNHRLTFGERKGLSNKYLTQKGIPVLESLPPTDDYREASFRDQQSIASRCIILSALVLVGRHEKTTSQAVGYFKKYNLWNEVSPKERNYLLKSLRSKDDDLNMIWKVEDVNVLLWALGEIDSLTFPNKECRSADFKTIPSFGADPAKWINKARIRNTEDILNETDLIYRMHWATEDASLSGVAAPARLNGDVVEERHYALNWLTMYEREWDDITTDT